MRGQRVEPTGRRAFACSHKDCRPPIRIFLPQGVTEVPRCPEHGASMVRQPNNPYRRSAS